jgi:hypothetical protein
MCPQRYTVRNSRANVPTQMETVYLLPFVGVRFRRMILLHAAPLARCRPGLVCRFLTTGRVPELAAAAPLEALRVLGPWQSSSVSAQKSPLQSTSMRPVRGDDRRSHRRTGTARVVRHAPEWNTHSSSSRRWLGSNSSAQFAHTAMFGTRAPLAWSRLSSARANARATAASVAASRSAVSRTCSPPGCRRASRPSS